MTPEGKVKEQIKKVLKEFDVYYHMPVQNGMGAPTLDFICCANGKYLAIEAKAPGKAATLRQRQTMDQIEKAGGIVYTVCGGTDINALHQWLTIEKAKAMIGHVC